MPSLYNLSLLLRQGGIIVFPTETYYAIGCRADCVAAVDLIFKIKKRPLNKQMPLLAANIAQAELAVELNKAPLEFLRRFWPGPLTVLLPARSTVAPVLVDSHKKTALRVSSSSIASSLAELAGFPLVCTSANLAGKQPVAIFSEIDPAFIDAMRSYGYPFLCIKDDFEKPAYTAPSTIIDIEADENGRWHLRVIRQGAIDKNSLTMENFDIVE